MRRACIERKTAETDIRLELALEEKRAVRLFADSPFEILTARS